MNDERMGIQFESTTTHASLGVLDNSKTLIQNLSPSFSLFQHYSDELAKYLVNI